MSPTIRIEGNCFFSCGGDFVLKQNILYVSNEDREREANLWLESYTNRAAFRLEKDPCGKLYVADKNGTLELTDSTEQKSGEPLEIRSL